MSVGSVARGFLSAVVLALGAAAVWFVASGAVGPLSPGDDGDVAAVTASVTPTRLRDYDWRTISEISQKIASADSEDGALTSDEVTVSCKDGSEFRVRLAGIRHDDRADGSGKAGLTFVACEAVSVRAMNSNGDNAGGWQESEMRSWLNNEELDNLPDELSGVIVPVCKKTNNAGSARDASAVTQTEDSLWLFSAREVCGDIDWFSLEYGSDYAWLDDVANAEGSQYEVFSEAGVGSRTDSGSTLIRTYGGKAVSWSYRTPFYYVYENLEGRFFYNVMDSGYPYAYTAPDVEQGVVLGFCV